MEPAEFVKRLASLKFESDLGMLERAEESFGASMAAYKGYEALAVAFTQFFLETVYLFNRDIVPVRTAPVSAQHGLFVEKLVRAFSTLRAVRIVAHSGYPLQGFTLLRNIYDDCVLAAAVMQGLTDFEQLHGVKPGEAPDPEQARRNRIAVERAVRAKMDGKESGLPAEVQRALRLVDDMYDSETHGGRVTTAYNMDWLRGSPLPVVPRFREDVASLFMNRWLETAWLTHRLVPFIQLPGAALSDDWAEKWRVIDDSFNQVVISLSRDLKKPYFKAVCDFVAAKFPFTAAARLPM